MSSSLLQARSDSVILPLTHMLTAQPLSIESFLSPSPPSSLVPSYQLLHLLLHPTPPPTPANSLARIFSITLLRDSPHFLFPPSLPPTSLETLGVREVSHRCTGTEDHRCQQRQAASCERSTEGRSGVLDFQSQARESDRDP